MSAIFSDPPMQGGLVNINIRANKYTPLDLTKGSSQQPPSSAPTEPSLVDAGGSSLFVSFDTTGIEGSQPIVYTIEYGLGDNLGTQAEAIPYEGSITMYSALAEPLERGTEYFMASVATNEFGTVKSAITGPFRTLE